MQLTEADALVRLLVLAVAGLAMLGLAALAIGQRRLIYHPDPRHVLPSAVGLSGVEEVKLATADGETVIAWWAKAPPGRPTVLYFHGNGGSLADRAERVAKYQAAGLGLFMMAYRSYSGSTGSPSEAANVGDAKLALQRLLSSGVRIGDVIVYGESLGTGVATQIAADQAVAGLILDSPYTSLADVGVERHPFLPVRLLLVDRYETMRFIGRVHAPLLVVHGEKDEIIPVRMGRAVYAAAREPKTLAVIAGAGHTDHSRFGSYRVILDWIETVWRSRPATGH